MRRVISSLTLSYSIHDSWTETLAGSVFLIDHLKEQDKMGDKAHLCRLVLISANHLIEKLFFDLVEDFANDEFIKQIGGRDKYKKKSFYYAMEDWPQLITPDKKAIDFEVEPFKSASLLRQQRNASIHKNSELVSLEMAQKALFSACEVCRSLWALFHRDKPFKYQEFFDKYNVEDIGHYSTAKNINELIGK